MQYNFNPVFLFFFLGSVMLHRWLLSLLVVSLLFTQSVYADDDGDEDDDDDDEKIFGIEAEGLGDISLYLLIGTILIVVWTNVMSIHISRCNRIKLQE